MEDPGATFHLLAEPNDVYVIIVPQFLQSCTLYRNQVRGAVVPVRSGSANIGNLTNTVRATLQRGTCWSTVMFLHLRGGNAKAQPNHKLLLGGKGPY